jgi:hypothetical protein
MALSMHVSVHVAGTAKPTRALKVRFGYVAIYAPPVWRRVLSQFVYAGFMMLTDADLII